MPHPTVFADIVVAPESVILAKQIGVSMNGLEITCFAGLNDT